MNESMHKYMNVGLIYHMAYPNAIKGEDSEYILKAIKKVACDDYFNAIEITWIKDDTTREKVKKMLDTSHMLVAYGAQPRLLTTGQNINHLDEDQRKIAVNNIKQGIDEAYYMNCVGLSFLSGHYEEATKEDSYNQLIKSTKELCAYAKDKGNLQISHEVFDFDVDKKSLVGPVALAKRYAEDICKEFDNFGLMVDLSHLPLVRETAKEAILPIKNYINHAHVGNAVCRDSAMPAYGDAHPRFGFPNGENDVEELVEFLQVLKDINFLNPENPPILSFEVKPWGDEDPDIVVANAKRTLNKAWIKVK
ncbi:MAG: xylose isomerase [Candidatus Epulonipiscium fishelsonii]|nr:MAG: xylose isomerase [Epulopiscium sp. AS2M-Bin002]